MTKRFELFSTPISNLYVLQRKAIGDNRGYFERLFCINELQPCLAGKSIKQINHSFSSNKGAVRGLHFQYPPHSEVKIVSCVRGGVFDVAVDIRRNSPTFLKWFGVVLTEKNQKTFIIPEGFAHGFQTLTDNCDMLYFHTASYKYDAEGRLNILDSRLSIKWPLPIGEQSSRDINNPDLTPNFNGVMV